MRQRGTLGPAPMPVEALREILAYNPRLGILRWKVSRKGCPIGSRAGGCLGSRGYYIVMIQRRVYLAHNVAWYLATGEWTRVDHIDLNKSNNRLDNLRAATRQQNGWNMRGRAGSGYKGVYPTPSGKWTARMRINGKMINFPSRVTKEEAYSDYCLAAREHHGEFARLE